jgi:hypothetical protein
VTLLTLPSDSSRYARDKLRLQRHCESRDAQLHYRLLLQPRGATIYTTLPGQMPCPPFILSSVLCSFNCLTFVVQTLLQASQAGQQTEYRPKDQQAVWYVSTFHTSVHAVANRMPKGSSRSSWEEPKRPSACEYLWIGSKSKDTTPLVCLFLIQLCPCAAIHRSVAPAVKLVCCALFPLPSASLFDCFCFCSQAL